MAAAQDSTYYNGTLGYTQFSENGTTITNGFFGFEGGAEFGDFMLSGALDVSRLDFGGMGGAGTLSGASLSGAYAITPSIAVGASFTRLDFDGSDGSFNELFMTFDGTDMSGPFFGRVAVGDGDFFSNGRYLGVTGGYEFAAGSEAALSLFRSLEDGADETIYVLQFQHSGGMFDVDGSYFGVSNEDFSQLDINFAYAVTPQIDVLADITSFDNGDLVSMGIGSSYEFTDGIAAYAKLNRLTDGSDSINGFGFGITFDMGEGSLKDQNTYERVFRPFYFNDGFPPFPFI